MTDRVTIKFGPPGTGKTTSNIETVAAALDEGTEPERVAFLSFTRVAAAEARTRAAKELVGLGESDLPYFRTLHSLAYHRLKLRPSQVMGQPHWLELADMLGLELRGNYEDAVRAPLTPGGAVGDKCLRIVSLARARLSSLEDEWYRANEDDLTLPTVRRFAAALDDYKRARHLVDFTDMLDLDREPLPVDLFVVDEAQDLTPQEWAYARRLAARCPRVVLSGDDDQAIYTWSGADPLGMRRFRGRHVVLPLSHRLPRAIYRICTQLVAKIGAREPKEWAPRAADGEVSVVREVGDIDLRSGTWLLLARNRHQLARLAEEARRQGVVYQLDGRWSNQDDAVRAVVAHEQLRRGKRLTLPEARLVCTAAGLPRPQPGPADFGWEELYGAGVPPLSWLELLVALPPAEREYVRDLRRLGEPLEGRGRVVVSTVHGVKGAQAENVLLVTDVSKRCLLTTDDELRVAYVGCSRASQRLVFVQAQTLNHWPLP